MAVQVNAPNRRLVVGPPYMESPAVEVVQLALHVELDKRYGPDARDAVRAWKARRIALVVVVAAATLALVGSSGAASGTSFRSKEYHYSMTLPGGSAGWKLSPAAYRWDGLTLMGLDSPEFDNLRQPARGWNVVVADRPLRAGTTLHDWTKRVVGMAPSSCQTPRTFVNTTPDSVPAQSYRHACADGYDVTKLTTIYRGKGYIILFASTPRTAPPRTGDFSTRSADRSDSPPEPPTCAW